jgi:hypothetical protein
MSPEVLPFLHPPYYLGRGRYILPLLVLLALLAGDILTTVWFTAMGLPEANLLIAPIAGDALAQVAFKAPFTIILIGGTWYMARQCDRLIPRSGLCAWVPVLILYSVPVIHNCAAIIAL